MKMNQHHQTLKFLRCFCPTLLLTVLGLSAVLPVPAQTQPPAVDPAATQILKRMCDHLGGLKQFSVYTQNTLEDMLDSHRVDMDVSARVIVGRPDRLVAQRRGDLINQDFYYNGKTLTLFNPADKVYATVPAPASLEGALAFAHNSLGLIVPASDLVYTNSYKLLMQDVTLATVVGKAFINGTSCNQLLFSRPGVDFQVWVADSGEPLPLKFVVTDTGLKDLPSVTTVMSQWNTHPDVPDSRFTFVPSEGMKSTVFLPLNTTPAK